MTQGISLQESGGKAASNETLVYHAGKFGAE
jgi:hypothetical protein